MMLSCNNYQMECRPGGLSMSCWVDSYISVLLKTVMEDIKDPEDVLESGVYIETPKYQTKDVTQRPGPEADEALRFVDKIITQSVAVFVLQEEEFANELVWNVLYKVTDDIATREQTEFSDDRLNQFADEFVSDILQNILDELHTEKSLIGYKRFPENKDVEVATGTRNCRTSWKHCTNAGDLFTTSRTKPLTNQPHALPKPTDDCSHLELVKVNAKPQCCTGNEKTYTHHQLISFLETEVDNFVIQSLIDAKSHPGAWNQRVDAVEQKGRLGQQRHQTEVTPGTPARQLRPSRQDKTTTVSLSNCLAVYEDIQSGRLDKKSNTTSKYQSKIAWPRSLLSSMRSSLFRLGFPVVTRRGNKVFLV